MDPTHLKGVTNISKDGLSAQIEENLVGFFNWAFLEADGFVNVPVDDPGTDDPYADEKLVPLQREGYANGRVWQAVHTDWVYETGLSASESPYIPTGVYVNGTFYPTSSTTGTYKHHINFPQGLVIFDAAIPLTSNVQVQYSYKMISFYDSNVSWFRNVVYDSYLLEQTQNTTTMQLLDTYRVQTPLIIIDVPTSRRMEGWQLGSGEHRVEQIVLFHVIAESKDQCSNLVDILTKQQNKTIVLYNTNSRREDNNYALDYRGSPVSGADMYPTLISDPPTGYSWKKAYFLKCVAQEVTSMMSMHRGLVRTTLEII